MYHRITRGVERDPVVKPNLFLDFSLTVKAAPSN